MTIKEMRALLTLTQREFAEKYNIPQRTLESWEMEERTPPGYVMALLERAVVSDYKALSCDDKIINMAVGADLVEGLSEEKIINNKFL